MFTRYRKQLLGIAFPILLLGFAGIGIAMNNNAANPAGSNKVYSSLVDQIRHELLMLPYNGAFDELEFSIENSTTVVLSGQVVRPLLKSEAEAALHSIPGVSKVVNNIEILPLSSFDDAIRLKTYRAIYSRPGFEKYATQAIAPIRIIVKNGNVILEGTVGSQLDKNMADMAARSVPGAFSVTDNLEIS
jgi:hyperosmotically inducible periplasmic protein